MKVLIDRNFYKDLKKLGNKNLEAKAIKVIEQMESAELLAQIGNLKKMKGYSNYYRVRLGDYRFGIRVDSDKILVMRFLHRKEIYKYFP